MFRVFVLNISPKGYFDAVYFLRQIGRAASHSGWSNTAPRLPAPSYEQTTAWLLTALAHAPVPIEEEAVDQPTIVITVDACAIGWGAIIKDIESSVSRVVAFPWAKADSHKALWSSVTTEPMAALRAALVGVPQGTRHVLIETDHLPLVRTLEPEGTLPVGPTMTLFVVWQFFPGTTFTFKHVPGAQNRADPLSRGLEGWTMLEEPCVTVGFPFPSVRVGLGLRGLGTGFSHTSSA